MHYETPSLSAAVHIGNETLPSSTNGVRETTGGDSESSDMVAAKNKMRQKGQYFSLKKTRAHPKQDLFLLRAAFRRRPVGVGDFKDEGMLADIKVQLTIMGGSGEKN